MTNTLRMTTAGSILLLALAGVTFTNAMTENSGNNNQSEKRQSVELAIESGNYEEFKSLTNGSKRSELITQENFHLLGDLHEARENKDFEKAKEIAQELGLKKHGKSKKGGCKKKRNNQQ